MIKSWWVSWYHPKDLGDFELGSPWWVSGAQQKIDASTGAILESWPTICAAVRAKTEEEAMGVIITAFDRRPKEMEWRFVEERPSGWSPFSERFPRADWMEWTNEVDQ